MTLTHKKIKKVNLLNLGNKLLRQYTFGHVSKYQTKQMNIVIIIIIIIIKLVIIVHTYINTLQLCLKKC